MRVSKDFIPREIAGEFMLVPIGKATEKFNGLIAVNEVGFFIFSALNEERTEDELIEKILSEYDIDKETAQKDLSDFLNQLRQIGALIED